MTLKFASLGLRASLLAALLALGCDDGSGDPASDAAMLDSTTSDAATDVSVADASAEPPITERCPDAQAGTFLLILYGDRVEAWRQDAFSINYFCDFLALSAHGIDDAAGLVKLADGRFLVGQGTEERGRLFAFTHNGEFSALLDSNINLAELKGLWPGLSGEYLAWTAGTENFYRVGADGRFKGTATLPTWQGSKVSAVTDVAAVEDQGLVMTFSDRAPKYFRAPAGPTFPSMGAAGAVAAVETDEGWKVVVAGEQGGPGQPYGVTLYQPGTGVGVPQVDTLIVRPGTLPDAVDLLPVDIGMWILSKDKHLRGFSAGGQVMADVDLSARPGTPRSLMLARIFPDF